MNPHLTLLLTPKTRPDSAHAQATGYSCRAMLPRFTPQTFVFFKHTVTSSRPLHALPPTQIQKDNRTHLSQTKISVSKLSRVFHTGNYRLKLYRTYLATPCRYLHFNRF
jgi:hypothetical protein